MKTLRFPQIIQICKKPALLFSIFWLRLLPFFVSIRSVLFYLVSSNHIYSKHPLLQIGSRTLNGLSQLEVLHLEDNLLTELNGDQLTNLTLLRQPTSHLRSLQETLPSSSPILRSLQQCTVNLTIVHSEPYCTSGFPVKAFSTGPFGLGLQPLGDANHSQPQVPAPKRLRYNSTVERVMFSVN